MKKRVVIIVSCTVAAAAIVLAVLAFMPRKIANPEDQVLGSLIVYRGISVTVDDARMRAILCRYDTNRSLGSYFPYEMEPDQLEVHLMRNNRSVHIIILDGFSIWYEPAGKGVFAIPKGQQLKEELLGLIRST